MNRELDWLGSDMIQRNAMRARNALGGVTITLSNDNTPVQSHQTLGYPGELRNAIRLQSPSFSSMPLIGAKAIVVYPGGNRAHGVIVGLEDARYRPTGLKPGEFLFYTVTGAAADGSGGTMRPILKGTVDGNGQLTGIEIAVGDGNTTNVTVTGSAQVNINTPKCVITNGGTPSPVMTEAGASPVLSADG